MGKKLGITLEELVQYVELKNKMLMCTGDSMDKRVCGIGSMNNRNEVLKIGDVSMSHGDYYVIIDLQIVKGSKTRFYGVHIHEVDGELEIVEGATYFTIPDEYIENSLGINITQLYSNIKNKSKLAEIEKLEKQLEELRNGLI